MKRSNGPGRCQPVSTVGLTTIVEPADPSLDIIFIHGFTGHPERTWTHNKGQATQEADIEDDLTQPPPKAKKTGTFSKSRNNESFISVYWPRDLVPSTVPNARVLTYGYDTHIGHRLGPPTNRSSVYDISWDFLVALEAERRSDPLRPALFIVHGLGGIVVKEMLKRSKGCSQIQPHLTKVFEATTGIIFFGTPHGGADPRGLLQHAAEKAIKAAGFSVNEQIVNALLPSSERLRELRDEFGPFAQEQKWTIHSFQEECGITFLGDHKVVEDTSSSLNLATIEITEHISRDHRDMCRFTGLDDVEYSKVAHAILRIADNVSIRSRQQGVVSLNRSQKSSLLESLRFGQIDAHKRTIKNAHLKTCKWLLKTSEFTDWLDFSKVHDHHGFLWIKGKPGTGKSTSIKYAEAQTRKTMKTTVVTSFYFNALGEGLENSTAGLYRSILLQLLERFLELDGIFDTSEFSTEIITTNHQWSIESLKTLLEQAIWKLGNSSVVCFIDALDECDEYQIRDMISFFEHVSEFATSAGIKFQVCFSSRHYPHITVKYGLELVLERQEGHNQDIIHYLDSELKIGHGSIAEQIREDVKEKANGVFMWVVLVVEILNKEHDSGRINALRQRLQEIPGDLHELFRDILTRDRHNRDELVLCVQWILFAIRPLRPQELYFAMRSGIDMGIISKWDRNEAGLPDISRFILSASKGLAEVTKSDTPKVQFIHESVRDFLLKENGLGKIWPDLGSNSHGQSHEQLKQCCMRYMEVDISAHLSAGREDQKASSRKATALRKRIDKDFPFLEYAVCHVLAHANIAEGHDIAQGQFIQNFQLSNWLELKNLLEKYEIRIHTRSASLLYVLAEYNLANLVKYHPNVLSSLDVVGNERYGLPLFAALATGSNDVLRIFMKAYAANDDSTSQLHRLLDQYLQNENVEHYFSYGFSFSRERTILSYLAEFGTAPLFINVLRTEKFKAGCEDKVRLDKTFLSWLIYGGDQMAVKSLFEICPVDFNGIVGKGGRPILSWAINQGYETITELLLGTGQIEVDSIDLSGNTPLLYAAKGGHEAIVMQLLRTSQVGVNYRDNNGRTPLWIAAEAGYEAVVEQLLKTSGVELNSKNYSRVSYENRSADTPLIIAAERGHKDVVKLLLETSGVEVNCKDDSGDTPLARAAERGHKDVVKLLLETSGVEVNYENYRGDTPLIIAAEKGHRDVVKLLLETGKVEVNFKDYSGDTPLIIAAKRGYKDVVKLLLETSGVKVNCKNYLGDTPLTVAAEGRHTDVVMLLLGIGHAEVNEVEAALIRRLGALRMLEDDVS